jgi:hypothetical protein
VSHCALAYVFCGRCCVRKHARRTHSLGGGGPALFGLHGTAGSRRRRRERRCLHAAAYGLVAQHSPACLGLRHHVFEAERSDVSSVSCQLRASIRTRILGIFRTR